MPSLPSMFNDLKYRLRAIVRRGAMEKELAAELQFHCERMAAKLVGAGVPREEALRRARLSIGGVEQVKEECREARGVAAFESTVQDVQYGLRQLRRQAGLRAGGRHLARARHRRQHGDLQPHRRGAAPYAADRRPGRTAAARSTPDERRHSRLRIPGVPSPPRREALLSAAVAAFGSARLNVSIEGSVEPTAEGQLVSGSYFRLLGVHAVAGRAIEPADDVNPNGHPVAVISHGYWKRRFGLEPSVVGRTIHLSGRRSRSSASHRESSSGSRSGGHLTSWCR